MKTILHLAFAIFTCACTLAAETETASARAQRIEIPRVQFRETTLMEACEFLSQKSRALDPNRKSVNILVAVEAPGRITLDLEKRPLLAVLRAAVEQVGCEVQEEPHALVIRKKGAPNLPAIQAPNEEGLEAIRKKLDQLVVPVVDFRDCTVREATEFLVQKSKQLHPDNAGVSVVLKLDDQGGGAALGARAADPGPAGIPGLDPVPAGEVAPLLGGRSARPVSFRCDEVPLLEVFRYTAGLAGLEVHLEKHAVVIRPPNVQPKAK
jgi:hypothetical protein